MPVLSRIQRDNAIGRLQAGQSQSHVVRMLHVSRSNISRQHYHPPLAINVS